jgi:hypothetical protein
MTDTSTDGPVDPRIHAAWREWLGALATDAEAVIAAGYVYDALDPTARDAWLDALAEDGPRLSVPEVALYAPLLAVETDPARRERMHRSMGTDVGRKPIARALRGIAEDGRRIVALVRPLYLSFVQVLACRYHPDEGFVWVRHDPILKDVNSPTTGVRIEDVTLEQTPLCPVVEELAHAVLAQRRSGLALPEPLVLFADLFDAHVDAEAES